MPQESFCQKLNINYFCLTTGLTVADLVFPWFIFIMGTSIDLSQRSLLSKGVRKRTIFQKIVIRSVKLFALGLFLNNGNVFKDNSFKANLNINKLIMLKN